MPHLLKPLAVKSRLCVATVRCIRFCAQAIFTEQDLLRTLLYSTCVLEYSWCSWHARICHVVGALMVIARRLCFFCCWILVFLFFPRRTYLSVSGGHGSNGTVPMVVASILQVLVWHVFFARVPGLRSPITWADCVGKHAKITNHLLQVSHTCSAKCGFEVRNMSKDSN